MIAEAKSEWKSGQRLAYTVVWGHHPLVVILANWELDQPAVVARTNGRCDQENVLRELTHEVNAMGMPLNDLLRYWPRQRPEAGGTDVESQGVVRAPGPERVHALEVSDHRAKRAC